LAASTIHDRKKIAAHWMSKLEFFTGPLMFNARTEANLEALMAPVPTTLVETIQTQIDIVETCQAQYELHA
jgi:hypothetical protein